MGLRLGRGEELHPDWSVTRPILQSQPAILQKLRPLATYQWTTHNWLTENDKQVPELVAMTTPHPLF